MRRFLIKYFFFSLSFLLPYKISTSHRQYSSITAKDCARLLSREKKRSLYSLSHTQTSCGFLFSCVALRNKKKEFFYY